jgi:hypothetical protein
VQGTALRKNIQPRKPSRTKAVDLKNLEPHGVTISLRLGGVASELSIAKYLDVNLRLEFYEYQNGIRALLSARLQISCSH